MSASEVTVCNYCRGAGAYHNGYVTLSCHRCLDGKTTVRFQNAAYDWEINCYIGTSQEKRDKVYNEYVAAKAERNAILIPTRKLSWFERLLKRRANEYNGN